MKHNGMWEEAFLQVPRPKSQGLKHASLLPTSKHSISSEESTLCFLMSHRFSVPTSWNEPSWAMTCCIYLPLTVAPFYKDLLNDLITPIGDTLQNYLGQNDAKTVVHAEWENCKKSEVFWIGKVVPDSIWADGINCSTGEFFFSTLAQNWLCILGQQRQRIYFTIFLNISFIPILEPLLRNMK